MLLRAAEEFGEASVALLQYARARKGDGFEVVRQDALCGELADACVMLEQLLILHPAFKQFIELKADYKIMRTLERYSIKEPTNGEG